MTLVEALPEVEHARRLGAGPADLAGPPGQDVRLLASLQRRFGNDHVTRVLSAVRRGSGIPVQRQGGDVALTGIKLSATSVTIPLESGLTLRASAVPSNATGVKFTVEKGSVDPTGVTIDETTGVITVAAGQQGGTVNVKATAPDGSAQLQSMQIVEKPVAIVSTSAASGGGNSYGGQFTHTFSAPSGKASGLDGGRINEKFDSLTAATPFEGPFTLSANAANAPGWALDASGTMTGPDNVDIAKTGIDIGRFTKSASNPTPKTLPAGFTMVQHWHAKSLPSGTLDASAFTDANHVRTLTAKATFTVEAGKGKTEDPYDGPAACTNAKAAPASVVASPPKPKAAKGGAAPAWNRSKVQVTADAVPSGAALVFSIKGPKLGCEIDASSGELLIGAQAGTITVRVAAKGAAKNFDEVTITITPAPPPAPTPAPGPGGGKTDTGEGADVVPPEVAP